MSVSIRMLWTIILFTETEKQNYLLLHNMFHDYSIVSSQYHPINWSNNIWGYTKAIETKLYPTWLLCVLFVSYECLYYLEFQKTINEANATFRDNINDNVQTKLKSLQDDIKTNKDEIKSEVDATLQYLKYVTKYYILIYIIVLAVINSKWL